MSSRPPTARRARPRRRSDETDRTQDPGFRAGSSILGRVTDAQGGVLPGARVTITSEATGVSQDVRSKASGNYVAPFLLPGRYAIKVEADAFKVVHRAGIIVQVQSRVTVDFALEVGPVSEVIEVRDESPLLQKTSPTPRNSTTPEPTSTARSSG